VLHAAFYADWVVDDAGISFAYARSLALGEGLVAQTGAPPVEAFSNPLWVALLVPAFWLELFDPYFTPWLLAAFLTGFTFWLMGKCLSEAGLSPLEQALVLILLALNGPWVCWLNCGLENPLYALLVTTLLWLSLKPSAAPAGQWGAALGLFASLVALTRPDGLLFVVLAAGVAARQGLKPLLRYAFVAGALLEGYLLFRWHYFDAWVSTPTLAKAALNPLSLFDPVKWHHLFRTVAGPAGGLLAGGMLFFGAKWGWRNRHSSGWVWTWYLAGAIAIFLLLPYDHLGWYRYATPFILLVYPVAWLVLRTEGPKWLGESPWHRWRKGLVAGALLATLALGAYVTRKRVAQPSVPLDSVKANYVSSIQQLAKQAGLETSYSVFVPDAGATLFYGQARVYDCIGLLDLTLARTLAHAPARYRAYLLDEARPDLIGLHGPWLATAGLLEDPAFHAAYVRLPNHRGPEPVYFLRRAHLIPGQDLPSLPPKP